MAMRIVELTEEEFGELQRLVSMQLQAASLVSKEAATEPGSIYPENRVSLLEGLAEKLRSTPTPRG